MFRNCAISICILALGFCTCGRTSSQEQDRNDQFLLNSSRQFRVSGKNTATDSVNTYWSAKSRSPQQDVELSDPDNVNDLDNENQLENKQIYDEESLLRDLPKLTVFDINIDPRDLHEKVPPDRSEIFINRYTRNWSAFETIQKDYLWESPNIRYQPLYFEDVALERYGQSRNDYWRTAVSAAHFFSSGVLLPLHLRFDPIYSCDYPLGYCSPGNCAPRVFKHQFWGRRR